MKLYYTPTSPYARKARVVARERGLMGGIVEIPAQPYQDDPALIAANPVGLVPALVLADGRALYDSPVVCDYLDAHAPGPRLIPAEGEARWRVLAHAALADAVMDFAVAAVMENRRPDGMRSESHRERALSKVRRSLGELARITVGEDFHMGSLGTAVALQYLDFRHPNLGWRTAHPALAAWLEGAAARPALRDTMPKE